MDKKHCLQGVLIVDQHSAKRTHATFIDGRDDHAISVPVGDIMAIAFINKELRMVTVSGVYSVGSRQITFRALG